MVCEKIDGNVRKIKREMTDEDAAALAKGIAEETGMTINDDPDVEESTEPVPAGPAAEADAVASTPAPAPAPRTATPQPGRGAEETELWDRMNLVTRALRKFLMSEANKVTKWVGDFVLESCSEYEVVLKRLILENARLRGRLEERRSFDQVSADLTERMNGMSEKLDRLAKASTAGRAGEACGATEAAAPKSYAVIVRGKEDDLTRADVRQRLATEVLGEDRRIKLRSVRNVRDGVIVETASQADRKRLVESRAVRNAGLLLETPKPLLPWVIVYDVPAAMTYETLLEEAYRRNLREVIEKPEFNKTVKIVRRLGRRENGRRNVIIELPAKSRTKLLKEGRFFVPLQSLRVRIFEQASACYGCLSFGHLVKDCTAERACWICGRIGHLAAGCKNKEDCASCRAMGRRSNHRAMTLSCPEYGRRVAQLRSRIEDG